ncbi:DUF262 domain-containing protein [Caulobacter sp. NIBR1757]|uniref:DUF262 domain-containing protein n=1 Tax=Caulobacter sp. NIBR1757 TaxID=3016000 RepID=UPI0022EFEEB1|nr:DUF262 domain-containing protein [Caulobacter sp. NIBR1757]WGM37693.1 hypothetical protein AMEJIAPC_00593 [Caulobacter sp. NIBR1757]
MSLDNEIKESARQIATDAYDMSVGELINIYRDGELVVNPEFQRLFRWDQYQKSHLIESLLIGVPLPSIFVFELDSGKWELIDGLQRVSTILEFVGILRREDGTLYKPSIMSPTRYLPSLEGTSWEGKIKDSSPLSGAHQISIKRSRLSIQILRKSSDEKAKYDLFQRLNSHGSSATPQELRNCVLYMIDKDLFSKIKALSKDERFITLIQASDLAAESQAMLDFITRFLVFVYVEYDKSWDIEEYLDNGLIEIADADQKTIDKMLKTFERTLKLLSAVGEADILKRYKDGKFQGRVGQAAFETVFLGVAQNVTHIERKPDPSKYILSRTKSLWARSDVATFTRAGFRGTDRIKQTIPFGAKWFSS